MKKKAKKAQNKEEIAEDWCFVCKDGGSLRVCDYKQCLKAYHPDCVGKDEAFLENRNRWTCNWHSCFICQRIPIFHCHCCPKAVCRRCLNSAEFVHVRRKKGFCNNCLKLALLVEEKEDVDSDGETVDFKDRETYEGLFMEYWEIINEKEGLTVEDLRSANVQLKMEKKYKSASDSDESENSVENQLLSDDDNMDDIEGDKPERKRKRSKGQPSLMKIKLKSKKKEFVGWGSKSLIQFLASIGKDTREKLSQHDVTNIINGYIKENKLFHPQKKNKVLFDARLQSVLGRKTVNKHRIYDILEAHFAENQEQSEDEEIGYDSEDKDVAILEACRTQRKSSADRKSQKKEVMCNIPQICFASIVAENIKLVYLKRSLVQQLLEQPETFENKIIGSFVRVKSDPNDCYHKNTHQLVQVTGIKKSSSRENDTQIFLQVLDMPKDIRISVLSDDDFSEEECEDLRQKVRGGLLKKLTIDELEQKARSLHEDITKHWIARELELLQNRIDRANEKGWRRELFHYLERRQLLQTSAEQSRLLQMVPKVIADVAELKPISEDVEDEIQRDEGSPKTILVGSSEILLDNLEGKGTSPVDGACTNGNSSTVKTEFGSVNVGVENQQAISVDTAAKVTKVAEDKEHHGHVSPEEEQHLAKTFPQEEQSQHSQILAPEVQHDVLLQREPCRSILEEKQNCSKAYIPEGVPQQHHILSPEDQSNVILQSEQHRYSRRLAGTKQNQPTDIERETVKSQNALADQLIVLSSDGDGHEKSSVAIHGEGNAISLSNTEDKSLESRS